MPTNAENIATGLAAVCAQIATWETLKPSYTKEGQSVQWQSHYESLLKLANDLRALQSTMDAPFEIRTRAR